MNFHPLALGGLKEKPAQENHAASATGQLAALFVCNGDSKAVKK
jgi:hypothetical protein